MRLYSYWRSSASWRVRIGLKLKGLDVDLIPVDLRDGEQHGAIHRARNALGQVPVLEVEQGGQRRQLTQSLAILQWLESVHPDPPLLPQDPWACARAWQMAEVINAGTQPLQNLNTQRRVAALTATDGRLWCKEFINRGLTALEGMAAEDPQLFLAGQHPSVADCCLVPQLYNARRFSCDTKAWPHLMAIEARAMALDAFIQSHPDRQPDAH